MFVVGFLVVGFLVDWILFAINSLPPGFSQMHFLQCILLDKVLNQVQEEGFGAFVVVRFSFFVVGF